MKKQLLALVPFMILLCFLLPAQAEEASEMDEWTVMFYICGSDLESKYSCATGNLEEIATVKKPVNPIQDIIADTLYLGDEAFTAPGKVNVLIETGGAKTWHAQELGMNIRNKALQIWRYEPNAENQNGTFALEAEQPLASMAKPETLSDFIRWSTAHYPAKKYGLVLWGHGGGSVTGIFIDELYDCEYMTLNLLEQAFRDGGAHFEAVLFDACMMANIETACAIQEHANWMIASEEMVAGKGTAIGDWLQQLYCVPNIDGRLLGRAICDTTMIKYSNSNDRQSQDLITWSVIDLSKIPRVESCFDQLFASVGILYTHYPSIVLRYVNAADFSESFGTEHEKMFDLWSVLFRPSFGMAADVVKQRDLQEALADAINYCVRGAGRPAARGLSFCYATSFLSDKLNVYAHNCPSSHYLALLDAISPWTAPDWVYEEQPRMPELLDEETYHFTFGKKIWKNGSPAFSVLEGNDFISTVQYNLYKKDESTGQIIRLGEVPVWYDAEEELYRVYDLAQWPSIDGSLCQIELQNMIPGENHNLLYNIPIMIDSELMNMRCAYWFDKAEYEVLGLWEGYDNDSSQFNRNVMSLAQVAGREYNLLHEIDVGKRGSKPYAFSPTMTVYRSMRLEEITLPPGTYYIQFAIYDVFMRDMRMKPVELSWDGKSFHIQDGTWEGTETLDISAYYSE